MKALSYTASEQIKTAQHDPLKRSEPKTNERKKRKKTRQQTIL